MPVTLDNPQNRATFVAPSGGVSKGVPVLVENTVVIPTADAAETESFTGVFCDKICDDFPAPTDEAWAVGDALYWDDTAKEATVDANGGANKLFAQAMAVKASAGATGRLQLLGRPAV